MNMRMMSIVLAVVAVAFSLDVDGARFSTCRRVHGQVCRIFVIYDYDRVGSRQILLATFREEDEEAGKFKTPGASSLLKVHCGKPCLAECQP